MSDSNNPEQGTASLSIEDAASQITALFGNDEPVDASTPAVEAEVPSHEDADTTEVHPETDTDEVEQPIEDAEPEATPAPSFNDDTEVEVDGKRIKFGELKGGYLRQSDYTRKTTELSQQRQQAESQVRHELTAQYTNHLARIEQNLVDHFPQEPNWMQLAEDNPAQYAVEREQWNKRITDLNSVRQLRVQHEQNVAQQRQAAHAQAQVEAYNDLVRMHPEFAKTEDGKISKTSTDLVDYALNKVGLPEELLQSVADARLLSVLYKSMKYDAIKAQESKTIQAVANKPPLAKPGTTTAKATLAHSSHKDQMARLKRTGSIDDAASILGRLL